MGGILRCSCGMLEDDHPVNRKGNQCRTFTPSGKRPVKRPVRTKEPDTAIRCPGCQSSGFKASALPGQCEFCDGTFNGEPPTDPNADLECTDIERGLAQLQLRDYIQAWPEHVGPEMKARLFRSFLKDASFMRRFMRGPEALRRFLP